MISRRGFLGLAAAGAAGTALRCQGRRNGSLALERPPNLLVIMADELAGDVVGCYGDTVVRTPNLDRLAAEGVLFERCYTPSPVCAPARLSFLSGKYVNRVGAWANSSWLPSDDVPSLPGALREAGYEAWLAGKMHLDATRRYGFEDLYDGYWNKRFKNGKVRRIDADNPLDESDAWPQRTRKFFERVSTGRSRWMGYDERTTEECTRFLGERRPAEGPFLLTVGYYAPHYPLVVPEDLARRYAGAVPPPEIPDGHIEGLPTNYRFRAERLLRAGGGPDLIRRAREHYWARVDWLDGQVGRLLEALDRSVVGQETVVIFTADHGELKGDHGLWWKAAMFESAVRVPLVVRWPERWSGGQRREGICSLLDVTHTLAALAGAPVPDDWNGASLVPGLDDPGVPDAGLAVSEFYGRGAASGFTMARQNRWKYVYHCRISERLGPERELYDLEADPRELDNLAGREEHADRVASLHAAMVSELGQDPEDSEREARAVGLDGYGREGPEAIEEDDLD